MITTELYELFVKSEGVCTDTRTLRAGQIFFALRGPSFNGNDFAKQALDQGASLVVTDEERLRNEKGHFFTDNALYALQALANYHRKQFHFPFVALTGSNGKTTTKELITRVLEKKYRVRSTQGNLNNHIGVPLTLLSVKQDDEIAVVEMGANHRGEIGDLCRIAEPTHGLITNIGKAHLEGFGGIEGVKKGKGELYDFLAASGKTAFINSTDTVLMQMAEERKLKDTVLYPSKNDFLYCEFLDSGDAFVTYRREGEKETKTRLSGRHHFYNICAALCIGKFFGVGDNAADEAVSAYVPENNRSQIVKKGSNTVILDAYNANPSSVVAALENLRHMESVRKTAILGDMFELGAESRKEHRAIVDFIKMSEIQHALFCGPEFFALKEEYPQFFFFYTTEEVKNYLKNNSFENAVVLVKGSRGMKMEETLDFI